MRGHSLGHLDAQPSLSDASGTGQRGARRPFRHDRRLRLAAQAPVERGKYLVNTILTCQNCHTPKGERGAPVYERDLSSGLSWDEPPFKVTASNITQDKETGIGNWSNPDIEKALRKGERPNGVRLAAIMPSDFYEILTPGDLNAIVAYLRTVKPVKQETPAPVYRIALPRHIPPGADKPFSDADMADKVKKGFYLVTIGHCMECHTPMGPRGRDFDNSFGKGGFEFKGPWGVSASRNIRFQCATMPVWHSVKDVNTPRM